MAGHTAGKKGNGFGKKGWFVGGGFLVLVLCMILVATNSASCQRSLKTWKSEYTGGLDRIVNVYDMEGDLIATYEGKIDIQENDSKVLFELNGKRYTYYNCLVEVIEK